MLTLMLYIIKVNITYKNQLIEHTMRNNTLIFTKMYGFASTCISEILQKKKTKKCTKATQYLKILQKITVFFVRTVFLLIYIVFWSSTVTRTIDSIKCTLRHQKWENRPLRNLGIVYCKENEVWGWVEVRFIDKICSSRNFYLYVS